MRESIVRQHKLITLLTCSREVSGSKLALDTQYPEVFSGFPQFLELNALIVSKIRLRPFYSASLPINFSRITLQFDAIQFQISTASLNKS
jgi:hypothetical protein